MVRFKCGPTPKRKRRNFWCLMCESQSVLYRFVTVAYSASPLSGHVNFRTFHSFIIYIQIHIFDACYFAHWILSHVLHVYTEEFRLGESKMNSKNNAQPTHTHTHKHTERWTRKMTYAYRILCEAFYLINLNAFDFLHSKACAMFNFDLLIWWWW